MPVWPSPPILQAPFVSGPSPHTNWNSWYTYSHHTFFPHHLFNHLLNICQKPALVIKIIEFDVIIHKGLHVTTKPLKSCSKALEGGFWLRAALAAPAECPSQGPWAAGWWRRWDPHLQEAYSLVCKARASCMGWQSRTDCDKVWRSSWEVVPSPVRHSMASGCAGVHFSDSAWGRRAHTLTEGRLAETKAACSPAVRDVSRRSLTSSEAERAALRDTWTALSPAKEVASSALGCPLQTDSCRPHDAISWPQFSFLGARADSTSTIIMCYIISNFWGQEADFALKCPLPSFHRAGEAGWQQKQWARRGEVAPCLGQGFGRAPPPRRPAKRPNHLGSIWTKLRSRWVPLAERQMSALQGDLDLLLPCRNPFIVLSQL